MMMPRFPCRNDDEPEDDIEPTPEPDQDEELPWDDNDYGMHYDPMRGRDE
jgi:hypothetical protein